MVKDKRVRVIIVAAAALGILAAGLLAGQLSRQAPARAATTAALHATIKLNKNPGETFAPAPLSAAPALTAQQAWQRFAHHVGAPVTPIPARVTVRLGLYTQPVGPANTPGAGSLPQSNGEAYIALNQLAYGYSTHSCPPNQAPVPAPHGPCIEWLFLNANTGKMIVETWQS